ncbi:PepSY domain-containing protein [Pseudogracilibacillus auburnensis]|uniref:Peptidase YpeB-like protein n=1 Tax=Pseudogracilibacillus auburnensis TaxID=1494959 RepID=A0A2V3VY21_9BACI|nr:PepSY domain-containing protein [Pseudogracilibacillus auburnensis]PXW85608.1 peptidase YpeB-like protein [Pseudogracilibacillus auburnensis]
MIKKTLITSGVIALAAALGFGIYHSDASQSDPKLTFDDIRNLVSSQYPGTITEIELEKKQNQSIYEVEIINDNMEYDLKLDGNSGEIIKLKEKRNVVDDDANIDAKQEIDLDDEVKEQEKAQEHALDKRDATGNEVALETKINKNEKKASENQSNNAVIDVAKAIDIAQQEFPGTVTNVELDEDDGRLIYEIEIEAGEEEAEFEIDAITGEIIVIEIDD